MNSVRNLLKVGLVANIFEWYEFSIYAYLIDSIGQLFFNAPDPISRVIQAFAVFSVGYLARPLGSLFFGMMGDRVGRGRPLRMALMMMAVPTALIGFLPTYKEIGVLAPISLLVLRLIQGFAMGGELPGNTCYVFEAAPAHRKSILCSVITVSSVLGTLLASFVAFLLFRYVDRQAILEGAWRIPFLLGIPLAISIGLIRREIHDLPLPQRPRSDSAFTVLRRPLLDAALLASSVTVFSYVITVWMPYYLVNILGYPAALAQLTNVLVLLTLIPFYLAAGIVAQWVGVQKVIKGGLVLTIISVYPLWFGLQTASFSIALATQFILAIIASSVAGVVMEALARHFSFSVRCRGVNIACTLPAVFLGSTTPSVCTWAIKKTGLLAFPAFYIMFFSILALPAAWRLRPVERSLPSVH